MNRELICEFVRRFLEPNKDAVHYATALYELRKLLPHLDPQQFYLREWKFDMPPDKFCEKICLAEIASEGQPPRPGITHGDLVHNIDYLRREFQDFGEFPMDVLVPLELDYPVAQIGAMISGTHAHCTSEEIVAEIYRRQGTATNG